MNYDLLVVAWFFLALAAAGHFFERDRPLLLAVHLLPFIAVAGEALGLPGSALVLPALGVVLLRQLATSMALSAPSLPLAGRVASGERSEPDAGWGSPRRAPR
jgi:hypothetical protein